MSAEYPYPAQMIWDAMAQDCMLRGAATITNEFAKVIFSERQSLMDDVKRLEREVFMLQIHITAMTNLMDDHDIDAAPEGV